MKKKMAALLLACLMLAGCAFPGGKDNGPNLRDVLGTVPIPSDPRPSLPFTPTEATEPEQTLPPVQEDPMELYRSVLDEAYRYLDPASGGQEDNSFNVGLWEVAMYEPFTALNEVGYGFIDLDGDGRQEMILGAVGRPDIYALYTCAGRTPVRLTEGSSRNYWSLTTDGTLYNQGSNGAMYSIFGQYRVTQGALECMEYYFSYEKDASMTEIGFYRNESGIWDKAVSQEISQEEFEAASIRLAGNTSSIPLAPMTTYAPTGTMTVQWRDEVPGAENSLVYAMDTEIPVQVVVIPGKWVHDFAFLELMDGELDPHDNMTYRSKVLYTADEPNGPIGLDFPFIGDLPHYGIRFRDDTGTMHWYAISMGLDNGILLLMDFLPAEN